MPDELSPPAEIVLNTETAWSIESALAETDFGQEYAKLATADTPAVVDDKPASDKGPEKPVAAAEEPKAEAAAAEGDEGKGRLYTEEEVEKRRGTAQRERDLARKEAESARADADSKSRALTENEFQRGVQLRTIQLLEQLTMQKGATDLQDLRQAQMQAYQEMQQAQAQITEADIQRVQQATAQEQQTQQQVDAANAKAESLFYKRAMGIQKEMNAAGVPTFDAETSLRDVLFSEKFQKQVQRIGLLPANAQEAAAVDLYEMAEEVVRGKGLALAQATQPKGTPPPIPQPYDPFPAQSGASGFDLAGSLENISNNWDTIVQANPHLQGR